MSLTLLFIFFAWIHALMIASSSKIFKQKNVYIREIKNIDKINDCTKDNPLVFTFIETKWPFVATAAISISKPYMFKITHLSVELPGFFDSWLFHSCVNSAFVKVKRVIWGLSNITAFFVHYTIFYEKLVKYKSERKHTATNKKWENFMDRKDFQSTSLSHFSRV